MSRKGGEIGVLKRRLQRARARPRSRIGHDPRMHAVAAVGGVADEVALPKRRKLCARDHDLPDLSTDTGEKRLRDAMYNELSPGDQGNVRGHGLHIGNNVSGKNDDPLPGELRQQIGEPHASTGSRPAVGSSTIRSFGSFSNACAMPTRWRIPPENPPRGRRAASTRFTTSSNSPIRFAALAASSPFTAAR